MHGRAETRNATTGNDDLSFQRIYSTATLPATSSLTSIASEEAPDDDDDEASPNKTQKNTAHVGNRVSTSSLASTYRHIRRKTRSIRKLKLLRKPPVRSDTPSHANVTHVHMINFPREILLHCNEVVGTRKGKMLTLDQLILLSLLSGVFIALGGLLALCTGGALPSLDPGLRILIYASVYPLGLALITITGSELFTGNCFLLIPAFIERRIRGLHMVKNLVIVYVFNGLGAIFAAWFFAYLPFSHYIDAPLDDPNRPLWFDYISAMLDRKTRLPFLSAVIQGIGANWLICLAVYGALAARDFMGKMCAVYIPIMAFMAMSQEMSISNFFFFALGMMLGYDITVGEFILQSAIPVTLGNIIGGSLFHALVLWYVYLFRDDHRNAVEKSFRKRIITPLKRRLQEWRHKRRQGSVDTILPTTTVSEVRRVSLELQECKGARGPTSLDMQNVVVDSDDEGGPSINVIEIYDKEQQK